MDYIKSILDKLLDKADCICFRQAAVAHLGARFIAAPVST